MLEVNFPSRDASLLAETIAPTNMLQRQRETLNHYHRQTHLAMQSLFLCRVMCQQKHLLQQRQWLLQTNILPATEPATKGEIPLSSLGLVPEQYSSTVTNMQSSYVCSR